MTAAGNASCPTAEEVEAHAKAHPLPPSRHDPEGPRGGAWLVCAADEDGAPCAMTVEALVDSDGAARWESLSMGGTHGHGNVAEFAEGHRWLRGVRWYPLDVRGDLASRPSAAGNAVATAAVLRGAGSLFKRIGARPLSWGDADNSPDEARVTSVNAQLATSIAGAVGSKHPAAALDALAVALTEASKALLVTGRSRLHDSCDGGDLALAREAARLAADATDAHVDHVERAIVEDLAASRIPAEEAGDR